MASQPFGNQRKFRKIKAFWGGPKTNNMNIGWLNDWNTDIFWIFGFKIAVPSNNLITALAYWIIPLNGKSQLGWSGKPQNLMILSSCLQEWQLQGVPKNWQIENNPNKNLVPWDQIFPWTWQGSAWSCLVLVRNDQKHFSRHRGYRLMMI